MIHDLLSHWNTNFAGLFLSVWIPVALFFFAPPLWMFLAFYLPISVGMYLLTAGSGYYRGRISANRETLAQMESLQGIRRL